jgi:hypothetical protein
MAERLCVCGRKIPQRYNSTIQPKLCPTCQLKEALSKKIGGNTKKSKNGQKTERKTPVKWRDKPTDEMIQHVQDHIVNKYIRQRDIAAWGGKSISDNGFAAHAGHYYSVGSTSGLRFCCQNIHGQSISGNSHMFKGGDLINYRKGLVGRYGEAYVKELDLLAQFAKGNKIMDRINVIMYAETYLYLSKNKNWVYRHDDFLKYADKIGKTVFV